jgi:hypothetical protein
MPNPLDGHRRLAGGLIDQAHREIPAGEGPDPHLLVARLPEAPALLAKGILIDGETEAAAQGRPTQGMHDLSHDLILGNQRMHGHDTLGVEVVAQMVAHIPGDEHRQHHPQPPWCESAHPWEGVDRSGRHNLGFHPFIPDCSIHRERTGTLRDRPRDSAPPGPAGFRWPKSATLAIPHPDHVIPLLAGALGQPRHLTRQAQNRARFSQERETGPPPR